MLVMRLVRSEFRRSRPAGLTVTQLRALAFLQGNPRASLSDLAEHLGLGAPTCSKLVAALVRRGLVRRTRQPDDRRRHALSLTPRGARDVRAGLAAGRDLLAARVAHVPDVERAAIVRGARLLRPRVAPRRA